MIGKIDLILNLAHDCQIIFLLQSNEFSRKALAMCETMENPEMKKEISDLQAFMEKPVA